MPKLKKAPDFIDPTGIDSFKYWSEVKFVAPTDGDTAWFAFRLGYYVGIEKQKIRLARINAPEYNRHRPEETPEGTASRAHLISLLENKPLVMQGIKTRAGWEKQGSRGRFLGEIYVMDGGEYFNANNRMVADGHAEWYGK